jgi:hypothetical protein
MELRRTYTVDRTTGVAVASGAGGGPTPASSPPTVHALVGDRHSVVGLTPGQFLKALSATTYGFASLPGILEALGELDDDAGFLFNDGAGNLSYEMPTAADVGAEPALGDPASDGQVLASQADGTRSWVDPGGGGGGDAGWKRVTLEAANTAAPAYATNCHKLVTPLVVGGGHCVRIRASMIRDTVAHNIAVLVSSDGFATYMAFSYNTDGNRVNYAYYGGAIHIVSNNAYTTVKTGAHVFEIDLQINSVANGGFSVGWTCKNKADAGIGTTAIPTLVNYTNVALDGADFQIATYANNDLADVRAVDVEVM